MTTHPQTHPHPHPHPHTRSRTLTLTLILSTPPQVARCREGLYSARPHTARCVAHNLSLAFEWKSYMFSSRDAIFKQRVLAAAAAGGRVVVIMLGAEP